MQLAAASSLCPPPSLQLLTTSAAFRALGPDHVFSTQLQVTCHISLMRARVRHLRPHCRVQGSLDGRLCIRGGGDPSLAWADLQALAAAAAQQQKQQPVAFTSLTVDTSIYTGDITPDTWEWGDLWAVGAGVARIMRCDV